MSEWLKGLILENWQRKLLALLCAIVIWLLINHSLVATKTFLDVPVRVINVAPEKTIVGAHPDGLLDRRITVTLSGIQAVLEELKSSDIEVVLSAQGQTDSWIAEIGKKDIICLNQEVDLQSNLKSAYAAPLPLAFTSLSTSNVPVFILEPFGRVPEGYRYLGICPTQLVQTVTGPTASVQYLMDNGLELSFDLTKVSKEILDEIAKSTPHDDEVSFYLPEAWKVVHLPFDPDKGVPLNDPQAQTLRIDFLKNEAISLTEKIPVMLYFSPGHLEDVNPVKYQLVQTSVVKEQEGQFLLSMPLSVRNVSESFLEVVKGGLLLVVSNSGDNIWQWSVQFINPELLEMRYVSKGLENMQKNGILRPQEAEMKERFLRERFQFYLREFELCTKAGRPLDLLIQAQDEHIAIMPNHNLHE